MGVLNDYVKYLPTLKDSPKAVPMTKKGNIPFGEADLAAIVLASDPMLWQNQYNLNHSMVPKSTCTLLPNLEAIEQVMVEKHSQKLKAKDKGGTARSKAKGNPKRKASGGPTSRVSKKGCSEEFCQRCKAHGSPCQIHNTLDCRWQQVSPLSPRIPSRSLGVIRAWPSCSPCSRLMRKARKNLVSLRSVRNATMTPVTVLTVNRKLGTATWDLV
jgi:hypothetical protein